MCGIFGYVGEGQSPLKVCLDGLKRMEYRGYDSAGIAGISKGRVQSIKSTGKIVSLHSQLDDVVEHLDNAIGHTRWATHGAPTKENAHPHFDSSLSLAIVHNGIIENHNILKTELMAKGVTFVSETDSEVIPHLIESYYEGDLFDAVRLASLRLEGSYSIAAIHKEHPETIACSANNSPLVLGYSEEKKECLLASDIHAFKEPNLKIIYLQKNEIALVTPNGIALYDLDGNEIKRDGVAVAGYGYDSDKGDYPHYMLKEIYEQPESVQRALDVDISLVKQIPRPEHVVILGCGTSYHAGLIAASLLEEYAGIPSKVAIASEFRYARSALAKNTLVIAISQSGETADTLAAVKAAKESGATILSLCNVPHSTLTRLSEHTLFLNAGPEVSVCSTKAFTSQLTLLMRTALILADNQELVKACDTLPNLIQGVLSQSGEIRAFAEKFAKYQHFFFLGRRYMFPTGLEAALKLKEITYYNAIGMAAGEMKHGPIALVSPDLLTIALGGNTQTLDKLLSSLMEIKARGGPIFAIVPQGASEISDIADDTLFMPDVPDALSAIPYAVATQLFAYYVALSLGREIDQPRNLAKSVTVE